MRYLLATAAAGVLALSTIAAANACSVHQQKSVEISKPVTTVEAPVVTPKPKG